MIRTGKLISLLPIFYDARGHAALDTEIFSTLEQVQVLSKPWRNDHNSFRPYSYLGYGPPAPEAFFKMFIIQNMPEMTSCPMEARIQKTLT